ncbi:MAG: energy-coupling factor transporter transmembrane protein EcfT [Candidatus Aminicenantes bacterium]|nr:energy-coupling factor transporter transmembrane protein EcfT [Candidatus Aminicenantes bacterium]
MKDLVSRASLRLDPRTGLLCFLAVLAFVVLLPAEAPLWKSAGLFFLLLAGGFAFSPQPVKFLNLLKKIALILIPFIFFLLIVSLLFSKEPASRVFFYLAQVGLRSLVVVAADLVFILSQRTEDLLAAMNQTKVPAVFIQLLNSGLRYSNIFTREATSSFRAKLARDRCRRPFFERLKITGLIIEKIFWRAIERSQRIYAAMLSRGYDGHFYFHRQFRLRLLDAVVLVSFLALLLALTLV